MTTLRLGVYNNYFLSYRVVVELKRKHFSYSVGILNRVGLPGMRVAEMHAESPIGLSILAEILTLPHAN